MTQGHKGSILPQKGGVSPIDRNTVFYAPYDEGVEDIIKGIKPIGERKCLYMNGTDGGPRINFPRVTGKVIEGWFYIHSNQTQHTRPSRYFLDFRTGQDSSWLYTTSVGVNWSSGKMYINGMQKNPVNYDAIPKDVWFHMYLENISTFTDDFTLFARYTNDENMKGKMERVRVWDRPLSEDEIKKLAKDEEVLSVGLVGYWSSAQSEGNILYDLVGGNDAIITQGQWEEGRSIYSLVDDGFHEGYLDRKKPTKNLVSNPFFLNNAESWINNSGTIVIDETAPYSSNTLKLTSNGTHIMRLQDRYGLNHGTYTYSYYVRLYDDFVSGTIGALVYIYYTDGTVQNSVYNQPDRTKINEWQRIESTFTTNTAKTISYIRLYGPWSNNMIGSFGATAVQLEESSYATEFVVDSRSRNESKGRALLIEEGTTNMVLPDATKFEVSGGWSNYSGAVITRTQNIEVPEWNTKEATRIQTTGGTIVIKTHKDFLGHNDIQEGRRFACQVKVKNIGSTNAVVNGNRGASYLAGSQVKPGEIKTVMWVTESYPVGTGGNLQIQLRTVNVEDSLDVIVFQPQVEEKTFHTPFVDGTRPKASLSYPKELINPAMFTFSAWVKLNVMPSQAGLVPSGLAPIFEISNGITGTNRLLFGWLASNELVVWRSTLVGAENSGLRTSSIFNSTDVGVWRFYTVTFDGTTYKVYVDGKLVGSMRMSPATYHPSSNLGIGGGLHGTLNGSIDEVRIDKVARTLEEIQAWYYQGRNGV